MARLSGYTFDRVGISRRQGEKHLAVWSELEHVDVGVSGPPITARYFVRFCFSEIRAVAFVVQPTFFGPPPLKMLAEILGFAEAGAPPGLEFSLRARHLAEWGRIDDFAAAELRATRADTADVGRLLRAANWRWARLEYRRALALVGCAVARDSGDVASRELRLRIELERKPGRPQKILARAREVLARDSHHRFAGAVRVEVMLGESMLGAETAAEAWLRTHPTEVGVGIALSEYYKKHGRYGDAVAVLRRLVAITASSTRRAALASAMEHAERLYSDSSYRRRQHVKAWSGAVVAGLVAICVFGGLVHRSWKQLNPPTREYRLGTLQPRTDELNRQGFYVRELAKAEAGDLKAMMAVSGFLEFGISVPKDLAAADVWRMRAAEAGHEPAMLSVARSFQRGRNRTKDTAKAQEWFERAAEAGSADAAAALGDMLYAGGDLPRDYATAFNWYERAAARQNRHAMRRMAFMHEYGYGVPRNPAEALSRYATLSTLGDAWAQNRAGWMLSQGTGVKRDPVEGLSYFRRAAEAGDNDAQVNLGLAYVNGQGVSRDVAEGLRWLNVATEKKTTYAYYNLGLLYLNGRVVPRDSVRGADLMRKAAELKYARAEFIFAQLQRRGDGVPKNVVGARETLQRLSEKGFTAANAELAHFYISGQGGVAGDFVKARELLMGRRETATAVARTRLALLQLHGLGGEVDRDAAVQNLRAAVAQKNSTAMIFLAAALSAGPELNPTPADATEIRQLLAAAAQSNPSAANYLRAVNAGGNLAALLTGAEAMEPRPDVSLRPIPATEGGKDMAPHVLFQVHPAYPFAMRYLEIQGEVVVDFVVSTNGEVKNAYSLKSTVPAFEAAAVAAVQRWQFEPGIKGGRVVPTHMQVPVIFTLNVGEQDGNAPNPEPL